MFSMYREKLEENDRKLNMITNFINTRWST